MSIAANKIILYSQRIAARESGMTVEACLLDVMGIKPRSSVKRALAAGQVFVNGKPVKKRAHVLANQDLVEVLQGDAPLHDGAAYRVQSNSALPIDVITATDDLVAINKPSGQSAHPLKPAEATTALNAIAGHYPEAATAHDPSKPLEGGLVHRIDRGTSGLLVCARHASAWSRLRGLWRARDLEKIYIAWVCGHVQAKGQIDIELAHDPKSKKRMMALTGAASHAALSSWKARTSFEPIQVALLESHEPVTLVLIRIHTGVMHQIRATFASLGHPVLGDSIYPQAKYGRRSLVTPHLEPLDQATAQSFKKLRGAFQGIQSPRPEDLPPLGFFLHAWFLKAQTEPALRNGVTASIPGYFGCVQA